MVMATVAGLPTIEVIKSECEHAISFNYAAHATAAMEGACDELSDLPR
jgi:hypothetical protein